MPESSEQLGPYGGRQAAALAPYVGKWVALSTPTEVLVAADNPQEVIAWLRSHGRRADYGMFRVPTREELERFAANPFLEAAGTLTGVFPRGHLEELRKEWD